MRVLANFFYILTQKISSFRKNKNADFIFYKIVDSSEEKHEFTLQCIYTNAIFCVKLNHITLDMDILHGLHPIQACYIGIEYAMYLKKTKEAAIISEKKSSKLNNYSISRYGSFSLQYLDRVGNLCFISHQTTEEFLMNPRDIALSIEIIQKFDAAQAFHIGFLAGIKMESPIEPPQKHIKKPHLRIVK